MDHTAEENLYLTEKLRNEDPEQFFTLVRMHLSFVLDLNADDCDGNAEKKGKSLKWNLPFTKKQKVGSKPTSEGTLLSTDFIAQMHQVIEFLQQEQNISQEGIFRRSGRVTRQNELKILLHQGAELNFNDGQFSVHECATVLKNVLSELPESILTDAHYPAYCQIADFFGGKNPTTKERLLRSIQLLILLLPNENRKFFRDIIELLHLAVSHEDKNRMSADNLATLFTPHLLCPRRLSPEALHTNSQVMSKVVAYMIQKGSELFEIPPTVATDVRAYWNKKERKKLSPLKQMNESVCDGTAASTVFSFVDRERTAQENRTNPTETALAQLYAYIQCLPESSKKRKLIKQFNKENGYGTPLRAGVKKRTKALNLGDSIKKHLSGFSKTTKRNNQQETTSEEDNENRELVFSSKKLQDDEDNKLNEEVTQNTKQFVSSRQVKPETLIRSYEEDSKPLFREPFKQSDHYESRETLRDGSKSLQEINIFESLPLTHKRRSNSPVKISPSKSHRLSSEHEMPRQPVISPSLSRQHHISPVSNQNLRSEEDFDTFDTSRVSYGFVHNKSQKNDVVKGQEFSVGNLYKTPRKAVSDLHFPEGFLTLDFDNQFKTPIQRNNISNLVRNTNIEGFLASPNSTNRVPILCGPKTSFLMTTSTPAPGNGCLLTPIVDKNNSMSPITKSTRRMPKAMQETMMTPRSRKPVISLSGTDLCNLANTDSTEDNISNSKVIEHPMAKRLILEDTNEDEEANCSLSSTFRNYLFSRSVLTASPVDLSFCSRTDDFLSLSDKNSSEENENFKIFPEILNEGGLSESLLYCLDGNDPDRNESGSKIVDCSCSLSDPEESSHHIYETAL